MSLLSLPKAYGNFKRLQEIGLVLAKHGFGHFLGRLHIEDYLPGLVRFTALAGYEAASDITPAERATAALQELGPTFIKFGQLLATRPDIVPPAFSEAFARLQDKVDPAPAEVAREVIEKALRGKIADRFSSFEEQAAASGSIGQVHFAVLNDGREVVVKVKRPGADKQVREDLELLLWLASLAEKHLPELAHLRPLAICEEFSRAMRQELDFVAEAASTTKAGVFLDSCAGGVKAPKVIWEMATRDVLVLERLHGTPLTRFMRDESVVPERRAAVAKRLAECFLKQFFVGGLFHADPHPGNILVMEDGTLALLDFGQTGRVGPQLRGQMALALLALNEGDVDAIADLCAELGMVENRQSLREFKLDLAGLLDRYYGVPLAKLNLGQAFEESLSMARSHGIIFPRDFVLLAKSFVTVASVAQELDPGFRMDQVVRPGTGEILAGQFSGKGLARNLIFYAHHLFSLMRRAPSDLRELLEKARSGNLRLIFHHDGLDGLIFHLDRTGNRLSLALVLAAIIIGSSAIVASHTPAKQALPLVGELPLGLILGLAGFGVATVLGLWLAWSIIRSGRL